MTEILSILIDVFLWYLKMARSMMAVGAATAAFFTFYAAVAAVAVVLAAVASRTPLTVRDVFETTRRQNPGRTSSPHPAACRIPRSRSLRGTSDCPC